MGNFLGIPGADWAGMGIQFGLNQLTAKQQFERQKNMMGIQYGNQQTLNKQQYERQRLLNQQGKDLSLQQWKDTNYPAQMKMLEAAGLNPALLYGMGGAGGATAQTGSGGTASGGSAASGQASQANPMDVAQMSLMGAQRAKLQAEADKIKGDTKEPGQEQKESQSRIDLAISQAKNQETQARLNEIKADGEAIENANRQRRINIELENIVKDTRQLEIQNHIDSESAEAIIEERFNSAKLRSVEIALKESNISLNETQIKALTEKVDQEWTRINQDNVKLMQENVKIDQEYAKIRIDWSKVQISKAVEEFKMEFPQLGQATGALLKGIIESWQAMNGIIGLGKPKREERKIEY